MCDIKDFEYDNDYMNYKDWKRKQRNKTIDEVINFLNDLKGIG